MSCVRDQTDGSLSQFDLACVSAYACVCLVRVCVLACVVCVRACACVCVFVRRMRITC